MPATRHNANLIEHPKQQVGATQQLKAAELRAVGPMNG
jgi:hypothetical protein